MWGGLCFWTRVEWKDIKAGSKGPGTHVFGATEGLVLATLK